MKKVYVSEGLRYFRRSTKRKLVGPKQYPGTARYICKAIIDDCWNGKYFRNSTGNYAEFWARDFGWCVDALLKLGYRDKVLKTLEYALFHYSRNHVITSTINPKGVCFNFPDYYSPDSVAYLFRSLRVARATKLIKKYKLFLQRQVDLFYTNVIDPKTGMVKRQTNFSGMRDYAIRDSSCYDNVFAAMLSDELDRLKFKNPLRRHKLKEKIKKQFWTGKYFLDDSSGRLYVTGDANLFQFYFGLYSKDIMKKAFAAVQQAHLDTPFPLKYMTGRSQENMIAYELFVPGWERNCIWAHMGLLYVQLLKKINPAKAAEHIVKYVQLVEKYKTFYELYFPNGKPYRSAFYHADEGMLWAANLLVLL